MVTRRTDNDGKRRTREHVVADLSVNHVERFVLRCGFTAERVRYDYGLDLAVITFNRVGKLENGLIWLQLKAMDRSRRTREGQAIVVRVEWGNLVHWVNEHLPVLLIVYDAREDAAFWLDVQAVLGQGKIFQRRRTATVTLRVPITQVVNEDFVRQAAMKKNEQLARWAEGILP